MRSRILVGSIFTILLLTLVNTCRQQASTSQSMTDETTATTPADEEASAEADWPGLSEAQVAQSTANSAAERQPQTLEGQVAVLTAEDADAIINVRSLPTPESDPIGAGTVGDQVILGRSELAEDGYTWYYVTFEASSTVGWIRSDLLDIQSATEPTAPSTAENVSHTQPRSDVLKQALDEQCGDARAIEAYFVTQSHTIYVCKVRSQRLYISQEAGTEQIITAQDVQALGGGYIIGNGNFEYRLDSGSFVVVRFDDAGRQEEVLRESVVYTQRY